jgi:hypothetical protein
LRRLRLRVDGRQVPMREMQAASPLPTLRAFIFDAI